MRGWHYLKWYEMGKARTKSLVNVSKKQLVVIIEVRDCNGTVCTVSNSSVYSTTPYTLAFSLDLNLT